MGPAVSSHSASQPVRTRLPGVTVTLEPLDPSHASDLYAVIGGEDKAKIFTYMPDPPFTSVKDLETAVVTKSKSEDPLFFAAIDNRLSKPVGWASLMRIDTKNRVIEIGHVLFSPTLQRTRAATEVFYILAKHAFDELGYRRLEWKCDYLNGPSKRAAIRLGFTFEGVFRQAVIYKDRNRDTAWFSIIDSEWPAVKGAFVAWLDDANFNSAGLQLKRLEDLREASPNQRGPVILEL